MVVQFPCLVCNRTVAKIHRAVQCDLCDSWVHIACNNLNLYTYQKLQKNKFSWYCMCCFQKELPYGSYHHLELCNLISNHKIKPNITGIPETRLQRGKQLSSKQCLWTYPNWIMKRMNTFIYWQKHKIQAAIWPKYPWKKLSLLLSKF